MKNENQIFCKQVIFIFRQFQNYFSFEFNIRDFIILKSIFDQTITIHLKNMKQLLYSLSLLILVSCARTGFNDDKYSFKQDESGITISSDSIALKLTVYRDDIIKVNYFTGRSEVKDEDSSCVIFKPDANTHFTVRQNKENLRIITDHVITEVVKKPFNINFYNRKNQPLLLGSRSYKTEGNTKTAFFRIGVSDHFYGLGQKDIPYVYSSSGWGVFFDNSLPGYFDLGKTDPAEWCYTAKNKKYTYYFIQGDHPQDLIRKYYDLTGYITMSPKWTLGLLQSRDMNENDQRFDKLDRSGFAGGNLIGAANWPEDTTQTWNAFKLKIPEMIGSYISGLNIFSGRAGDKVMITPELYTRWFEFAVFSPLLKPLGDEEQSRESYDELTSIITSSYLKLRYRLTPYLYSYMYRASKTGEPLIKSLFFLFDDPKAAQYLDTEYMFGNEFLVAPVTEKGQVRKTIYLPQLDEGYRWIDYWTDEPLSGGNEYSFKVPVQEIPLFIKQPAVIPMAKLKGDIGESPDDTLTIEIYPGGYTEFLLYEDDGTTNNYLNGEFATTMLTTDKAGKDIVVKISAAEGTYPGMIEERTWLLVIHLVKGFDEILVNGEKLSPVEYVRALTRNSYYYDLNSYLLVMDVGGSVREDILLRIRKCTLIE
jgi:alpha-glucosidase (family GH31 glycosyl hydrolase)